MTTTSPIDCPHCGRSAQIATEGRSIHFCPVRVGKKVVDESPERVRQNCEEPVQAFLKLLRSEANDPWIRAAGLSADAGLHPWLFYTLRDESESSAVSSATLPQVIRMIGAQNNRSTISDVVHAITRRQDKASLTRALAEGLNRAGTTITKIDNAYDLVAIFSEAAVNGKDSNASESARLNAIELLGVSSSKEAQAALIACLGEKQPEAVQTAAIRVLAQNSTEAVTTALIGNWPHYGPKAQSVAMEALLARDDRAVALLEAKVVKPEAFSAAQVQALIKHKSPKVAAAAKTALASVIPPSREEMAAKFKPSVAAKGDTTKGQTQFMGRCMICHKAGANGFAVDVSGNGGGIVCPNYVSLSFMVEQWRNHSTHGSDVLYSPYDWRLSPMNDVLWNQGKTDLFIEVNPMFDPMVDPTTGVALGDSVHDDPRSITYGSHTSNYSKLFNWDLCPNDYFEPDTVAQMRAFEKIIILTDGTCGSSCAYFLSHLRSTNKVRVVSYGGADGFPLATSSFAGGNVYQYDAIVASAISGGYATAADLKYMDPARASRPRQCVSRATLP